MCLTIPGMITKIDGETAEIITGSFIKTANITMIDNAAVGDYVIVQQGFAIEKIDRKSAQESLEIIKRQIELTEGKA